jgi:hypothetical protein
MEDWPDFFTGQEGILNNSQNKQGGRLPCPNKTRRKADQLAIARQEERLICFLCNRVEDYCFPYKTRSKIGLFAIVKQEERLTFFLARQAG